MGCASVVDADAGNGGIKVIKKYKFYGWQEADCKPPDSAYEKIENPRNLYDILSQIWCAETCAPRMREKWSRENQTLGQCSITAFLIQDIFGGKVYGIPREGGKNFHCYNVVALPDGGECIFDAGVTILEILQTAESRPMSEACLD